MDKNTLLAFLLISIVLVLTPRYLELINPAQEQEEQTQKKSPQVSEELSEDEFKPEKSTFKKEKPLSLDNSTPEKNTKIETALYIATISNVAGGSIKEFFIKGHKTPDSNMVNLINAGDMCGPIVEAKDLDGNPLDLSLIHI